MEQEEEQEARGKAADLGTGGIAAWLAKGDPVPKKLLGVQSGAAMSPCAC